MLLMPYLCLLAVLTTRLRRSAVRSRDQQAGASTLEMVIIALGLFLVAAALVAAITAAVQSRLAQIN